MSATAACGCGSCATCSANAVASERPGRRGLVRPERLHGALKKALLAGIAAAPELDALSADAEDDPTLALADAWAAALHVLSFYVERFHGESYIDTAVELTSVDALARMVGYRPAPAISAATVLTFTTDATEGAPPVVPIPPRTKVQIVPRPGELPVVFETAAELEARPTWNELLPRRFTVPTLKPSATSLRVSETQLAARPGDTIVVLKLANGAMNFAHATIDRLEPKLPPKEPKPHQVITLAAAWTGTVPDASGADPNDRRIVILSRRAALFGYNAPPFRLLPMSIREELVTDLISAKYLAAGTPAATVTDWPGLRASRIVEVKPDPSPSDEIDLDAIYPEAYRGRHVLLTKGTTRELYRIIEASEVSRTDSSVTAKVTRLKLDRALSFTEPGDARVVGVLIETERVTLADQPISDPAPSTATKDRIELAAACDLPRGRLVVLRGVPADSKSGTAVAETVVVKELSPDGTTVVFTAELTHQYDPQTLSLLGNATPASHGETKMLPAPLGPLPGEVLPEILGGGDARRRHQPFALRQPGLTYLSAPNAAGYAPALEVAVDGVARPLADSLFGLSEDSRAYVVETETDAPARVRFAGRLRTGTDNVTAIYRVGGGPGGNLDADRLIAPLAIPAGVRGVTNPVPATGGVAAEDVESARLNAPIRVVTLDRVVSLGDYEAYARARGGISQALATLVWNASRQIVCLTVAGADGASVPPGSVAYRDLRDALLLASAPGRTFRLFDYVARPFGVRIAFASDPSYRRDDVLFSTRNALTSAFAPAVRCFGAPVARSHLLACVQSVPGVIAARVESLTDSSGSEVSGEVLGAAGATATTGAELLMIDPARIVLTEMPT